MGTVTSPRVRARFDIEESSRPRPAATVLVVDDDSAFRALVCQMLDASDSQFLQKPFTTAALLAKVRALLDSRPE
jgi:DNA-binding response OmpR family regulator